MTDTRRTIALIPAAGRSGRFTEVGHIGPKGALVVRDRDGCETTMILHVMMAIPLEWPVVIGTTTDQVEIFRRLVGGVPGMPVTILDLGMRTGGQADTIHKVLELESTRNDRIVVINCDNVFRRTDLLLIQDFLAISDMSLLVHKSTDPMCSYVVQIPLPTRFVE